MQGTLSNQSAKMSQSVKINNHLSANTFKFAQKFTKNAAMR